MGDTETELSRTENEESESVTLTRRDAVAALSAGGVGAIAGCLGGGDDGSDDEETVVNDDGSEGEESGNGSDGGDNPTEADDHGMQTMRALGTVLYPSDVEIEDDFLSTYLFSRIADEESYRAELNAGVETLDGLAMDEHDSAFRTLESDQQVTLIENTDIRSGESVPDGSDIERLNYHVIDELLFAFYASPTGGELVGNPNPVGFNGGYGYRGSS